MFAITELTDESSNSPTVQLSIKVDASADDIAAARTALPQSVRERLRPTPHILFILRALKNTGIQNPCFSARFVLPG